MNRKYSVGLLVTMSFCVLLLLFIYGISSKKTEPQNTKQFSEEQAKKTEGDVKKEDGYIIAEQKDFVIVYYSDFKTVYEYTSIRTKFLPNDIYEKIKNGIYMENLKEVYGFLENYSS